MGTRGTARGGWVLDGVPDALRGPAGSGAPPGGAPRVACEEQRAPSLQADESAWPVLVCLLGSFRVLRSGKAVAVRGAKAESLLCHLALRPQNGAPRETLLCALWPNGDPGLAGQSLNSLVYSLHRTLGTGLEGAPPVVHEDGWYRLNTEAGVGVDAVWFDALTAAGERRARGGDHGAAAVYYRRAVRLFRGDLCAGNDAYAVVERERLRARHLTLLARLADRDFRAGDYGACLEGALRLLALDPCREDAHRLVMRCYVRRGERAQAMRQFRVCERILRSEFDAPPEAATLALFEQVRTTPEQV
jgi:DNA-binding SARP family transcriptional activator